MNIGSQDLISNLPDALVCHILSFLSTKDAASTSILSKRWRYILAFVPNLDIDDTIHDDDEIYDTDEIYYHHTERKRQHMSRSFMVFVDRLMALQGSASLNKFTLRYVTGCEASCVDRWILNVLDRGVVDLELSIFLDVYSLPSKVFTCKTLVRLELSGTNDFIFDEGEVIFPKLKTLCIYAVTFQDSGNAFFKLISSCPVLEEFYMAGVYWDLWEYFSVSNPSLKRIRISCDDLEENPKSVSFATPNVVYLDFSDAVAIEYPVVNFDSLLEARVDLRTARYQNYEPDEDSADATGFLMGICNVEILYLSANTLKVLDVCCKTIPVFDKLYHLTIKTNPRVGWESLPYLLEKCPNLETLVFDGLFYKHTNRRWNNNEDWCTCKPWDGDGTPICLSSCSLLLSSPVKILKILNFGEITSDMDRQMDVIKYFLETMPNLEQVMIHYDSLFDDSLSSVSAELKMLGKVASRKCKIQVISNNISFSFTVQSSSSTSGVVFFNNTFPV